MKKNYHVSFKLYIPNYQVVYLIFTLLKAMYVLPVKCLFMIFAHFSIGFCVFSFLIGILPLLVACVVYVWVCVGFYFGFLPCLFLCEINYLG